MNRNKHKKLTRGIIGYLEDLLRPHFSPFRDWNAHELIPWRVPRLLHELARDVLLLIEQERASLRILFEEGAQRNLLAVVVLPVDRNIECQLPGGHRRQTAFRISAGATDRENLFCLHRVIKTNLAE